jgi:hypothetical protein
MTLGFSMVLSSAPIEAIAATIRGGEDGASDAGIVEAAGKPTATSLVTGEVMASATIVVSRAGTPSPPASAVTEPWGMVPSGASGAPLALGAPPVLDPIAPVTRMLVNKKSNQIQYN